MLGQPSRARTGGGEQERDRAAANRRELGRPRVPPARGAGVSPARAALAQPSTE
jgi:hypothetical protein